MSSGRPPTGAAFHAGYARYFTPPPFELVANETVARFVGTTAEAPGTQNDTPRSERDHYFDVGFEQKFDAGLSLGVDIYYKTARNLIDEGQFGAPIILTPFNYREGYAKGVELSGTYRKGPFSTYANLAWSQAKGRDIVSSQFNFDPAELADIASHGIYLDHDQTYTFSGGATYRLGATRISADALYGSGLRATPTAPRPTAASAGLYPGQPQRGARRRAAGWAADAARRPDQRLRRKVSDPRRLRRRRRRPAVRASAWRFCGRHQGLLTGNDAPRCQPPASLPRVAVSAGVT